MKRTLFLAIGALFLVNGSFAQKVATSDLPPAVATAFSTKFAKAEKVVWEMDYEDFEADFKLNKIEISAKFDKDGNWLETETPMTLSNLPAAVKTALAKQFDPIKDPLKEDGISKVETPNGTTYEIDGQNNAISYILIISEKGDLIKKEEVKEEKEGKK